jgi:hypothetical protein
MKKLLLAAVLALPFLAASGQSASAWSHFKFGCGLNMEWTKGGNNVLWGAYKSSDVPGAGPIGFPGPDMGYPGPELGMAGDPGYMINGGAPQQGGFTAPAPTPVKPTSYDATYYGNGYQPVGYYDAYQGGSWYGW